MDEGGKRLINQWRSVLVTIIAFETKWNAFQQTVFTAPRDTIAELPIEAQKAIAKWGRSVFSKAAPNMIEHLWATGGFREHLDQLNKQNAQLKPKKEDTE